MNVSFAVRGPVSSRLTEVSPMSWMGTHTCPLRAACVGYARATTNQINRRGSDWRIVYRFGRALLDRTGLVPAAFPSRIPGGLTEDSFQARSGVAASWGWCLHLRLVLRRTPVTLGQTTAPQQGRECSSRRRTATAFSFRSSATASGRRGMRYSRPLLPQRALGPGGIGHPAS